jgi:hypothetical protein
VRLRKQLEAHVRALAEGIGDRNVLEKYDRLEEAANTLKKFWGGIACRLITTRMISTDPS